MSRNLNDLIQRQWRPDQVQRLRLLGQMAKAQGMTAWLVGGSVRDLLLERPQLDLDLTLEGDAPRFVAVLQAQMPDVQVRVHGAFGTSTVFFADGEAIDIATSRAEHYPAPAELPQVAAADIHTDLKRRDFAVNAMAVCLAPDRFGQLFDPYNGLTDLHQACLRVLHAQSFIDDPTRILRGLRFEARLGFRFDAEADALVLQALQAQMFTRLSGSRLWRELGDLLDLPQVGSLLARISAWPDLAEALWGCPLTDVAAMQRQTGQALAMLDWYRNLPAARALRQWALVLRLLLALQPDAAVAALLQRYQWPARERDALLGDLRSLRQPPALAGLDAWGRYQALSVLSLEGLLALAAISTDQQPIICDFVTHQYDLALPLNGGDLLRLGIAEGPAVGQCLLRLRQAVVMGEVASRQDAEQWILKTWKQ